MCKSWQGRRFKNVPPCTFLNFEFLQSKNSAWLLYTAIRGGTGGGQFTIIKYADIVNWLASVPIFELRVCTLTVHDAMFAYKHRGAYNRRYPCHHAIGRTLLAYFAKILKEMPLNLLRNSCQFRFDLKTFEALWWNFRKVKSQKAFSCES